MFGARDLGTKKIGAEVFGELLGELKIKKLNLWLTAPKGATPAQLDFCN
jgi:hypothetical protein